MNDRQLTVYPTYGYKGQDGAWHIPMRVWIRERHPHLEEALAFLERHLGHHSPGEIHNFTDRIADLVADSVPDQPVAVTFEQDATRYLVEGKTGNSTDEHGLLEGVITVDAGRAEELLRLQGSRNGWLNCQATSGDMNGAARVQLLPDDPNGLSVVSDIDDTIKVTEIPAGLKIVLRNTFLRDFVAVTNPDNMASAYEKLRTGSGGIVSFHYVSGGPWQLYVPMVEFLIGKTGFPQGTFHLKTVNASTQFAENWLEDLIADGFNLKEAGKGETEKQKVTQITELMTNLPRRQFVLFGDSGERDPEAYARIRKDFPSGINEIHIRDVLNDPTQQSGRLSGMTVRHAPTIFPGRSQFP